MNYEKLHNRGFYQATDFASAGTIVKPDNMVVFQAQEQTGKNLDAIESFVRKFDATEYRPVKLVPLEVHSGELSQKIAPATPRRRRFVSGLGKDDTLYLSFSETGDDQEGQHGKCQTEVLKMLGSNARAIFHGRIYPEIRKTRQMGIRAKHVMEVYQLPDEDVRELDIASVPAHELGKIMPGVFMNEEVAQRLMRAFWADRLDIVFGKTSNNIYQAPHIFRDGD